MRYMVHIIASRQSRADLEESVRSHQDLEKGIAKLFKPAEKHFTQLGDAMIECGHVIDVFACALEQVGLS